MPMPRLRPILGLGKSGHEEASTRNPSASSSLSPLSRVKVKIPALQDSAFKTSTASARPSTSSPWYRGRKNPKDADTMDNFLSPPSTPGIRSGSKNKKAQSVQEADVFASDNSVSQPPTPRIRSGSKNKKAQSVQEADVFASDNSVSQPSTPGIRSGSKNKKAQSVEEADVFASDTFVSQPSTPSLRTLCRSKYKKAESLQDWVQQSPPLVKAPLATEEGRRSTKKSRQTALPREDFARQLSFANLSMDELIQAVEEEENTVDWLPEFWDRVLTLPVPQACKTMAMRPLSHWVTIYNKWQAMGNWTPGKAPQFFNAFDAQHILSIPLSRVMEFVKLFDPASFAKANLTKTSSDYEKVRLPVSPLLAVCILMSSAIAKSQKVRFLLGVFDENDDRRFDENEFVEMIQALLRGMGAMLGLLKDAIPSNARIDRLARRLFRRMSDLHSQNLGQVVQPGSVPNRVVEDWILGESDDPLNLPFALFVKRFSVGAEDEDPEAFEDDGRKFQLSHRAPVDLPLETAASLDGSFLTRYQVIAIQRIFKHCLSIGNFDILHSDAEAVFGPIETNFWIDKLHRGLLWMEESRGVGKSVLSNLFKSVCPKATGRHLRMFHNWVKDYDQLEVLRRQAFQTRRQLHVMTHHVAKPRLPAELRRDLLNEHRMRAPHLEQEDYLQASAPTEYRTFPGHPVVDEVFIDLLTKHLLQEEEKIQQKQRLYLPNPPLPDLKQEMVKRRVDKQRWNKWNEAFDLLELENDEATRPEQLLTCRMLPPENVDFIFRLVARTHQEELIFTRRGFLETLCALSHVRALPVPPASVEAPAHSNEAVLL